MKKILKIIGIVFLIFIILGVIGSLTGKSNKKLDVQKSLQEGYKKGEEALKIEPTKEAKTTPIPAIPFDKTLGNNYVAAAQSQNIQGSFSKTIPGLIKTVYTEFTPQDIGGNSEYDYEKSVLQSANITITVDADIWASNMSDSIKKDFVAGLIKTIKGNINVYPHITVSDGIRTVATGSWSVWNGEANITLK